MPSDNHRGNLAKKVIQTWKDRCIGVLSGTAASFLENLWCQVIPQANRQLLLLRQSKTNSKIYAYSHVYGPPNYDANPFVPVGMETLVRNKPKRLHTFSEHCNKGFFLSTSFDHYRACTMCMKDTQFTRVSATVFHKHKYLTNLAFTPSDRVITAAKKLANEIKGRMLHHLSATSLDHLERLGTILKQRMPQIDASPTIFLIPQSPPTNPLGRVPHTPPHYPLVFPPLASAVATPPPRVNPRGAMLDRKSVAPRV